MLSVGRIQPIGLRTPRAIRRIDAPFNQPVKRRVWPIGHPRHQAMFDGVDVDVIHVGGEIGLVPNEVFPVAALPDGPLPASLPDGRAPFVSRDRLGEAALDQAPAQGKVRVMLRKRDQTVEMVGHHHPAVNRERMRGSGVGHDAAQVLDVAETSFHLSSVPEIFFPVLCAIEASHALADSG